MIDAVDFRHLEAFCEVVERSSFSKAARALGLAQASVSERVARLEALVGASLLDRLGRSVAPTPAGELLHRRARDLLARRRELGAELEDFLGACRGELDVGASTIPGDHLLPAALRGFSERYPEVVVRLHVADSEATARRVGDGSLELGVVGSRFRLQGLEYHPLWPDELVLALPPDHRWAGRPEVPVAELLGEPFVLREPGSGTRNRFERALTEAAGTRLDALRVVAQLGTSTAVKEAVRAGLGLSVLSARALETEVSCGLLARARLEGLDLTRRFHLVTDRRRTLSPAARALADYLATVTRLKVTRRVSRP